MPIRVFISYETATGTSLASTAHGTLSRGRVEAWVWHLHHRSGSYTFDEIAERIADADFVLFICSSGTKQSNGQRFEINTALALAKRIWVIATDKAFVPPALVGFNYDGAPSGDVEFACDYWLTQLQNGFKEWPTLERTTDDESA